MEILHDFNYLRISSGIIYANLVLQASLEGIFAAGVGMGALVS